MQMNKRLWLLMVILALVSSLLICSLMGRPLVSTVVLQGDSMEPTFNQGDVLLCVRIPLQLGQVVVATEDDQCHNNLIVKRIRIIKTDGYGVKVLRMTADNEPSGIYWAEVAEVKGVVLARIW